MLDSTDKDNVSILASTGNEGVSMTNDRDVDEAGNSTPQTVAMMMASFRVDRETWAKFGAIAKRERLTATDVLTDYIQRCTDNDRTEYGVSTGNDDSISTDTYATDKLNDAVMTAISTLSLPDQDAVMMMVSTAIETSLQSSVRAMIESALAPITEQVTEVESFTRNQIQAVRDELKKL